MILNKSESEVHVSAVIFAGGTGERMGSEIPKQFLEVDGRAIVVHTLVRFENNSYVNDIVLVCKESWIDYAKQLIKDAGLTKVKWVVPGGSTGQLSIYAGLAKLRDELMTTDDTVVLIHDGVRPLIDDETINSCINSVLVNGSAVTVAPAIETVITLDDENKIDRVVERGHCRMAKAPQAFLLKDILAVHDDAISCGKIDHIDSASIMSEYGYAIFCVDGPIGNIKITSPTDFHTFKAIYDMQKTRQNV